MNLRPRLGSNRMSLFRFVQEEAFWPQEAEGCTNCVLPNALPPRFTIDPLTGT